MQIVKIKWLDAASDDGAWVYKDDFEAMTPAEVESVGFVLKETKDYVTLVQSVSPDQYLFTLSIPQKNIIKMKLLS